MDTVSALSCLVCVLNCLLVLVFGESSTNSTIASKLNQLYSSGCVFTLCLCVGGNVNDTETTSSTTEIPLVSNRTTEWEKRVLFNFLIVVSVFEIKPVKQDATHSY